MDFADHHEGGGEEEEQEQDEEEEEIMVGLPVGPGYDATMGRGGGRGCGGGDGSKIGSGAKPAVAAGSLTGYGRKLHGGGGGGGRGKYRECLKNHAVGIGGHAVDGCGEFMPAGEDGSLDALRCAACGCHRNFHRKDVLAVDEAAASAAAAVAAGYGHPHFSPYFQAAAYLHHPYPATALVPPGPPPPPHQYHQHRLALPSTSGGEGHFREETEEEVWNSAMASGVMRGVAAASASGVRKRFRTKFTPEQKEKMLAFAEWVGWRIPKHQEAAVQKFCEETSIKRHVLKVWMHNNKHTLAKKP